MGDGILPIADPESELREARQLTDRYRSALERIVATAGDHAWCRDYAMCDHEGCAASHAHIEIAMRALDVSA